MPFDLNLLMSLIPGASLYNINVANLWGQNGQAIVLSVQQNPTTAYGVQLTGFQDTYHAECGL
jgi:hypothetical protein